MNAALRWLVVQWPYATLLAAGFLLLLLPFLLPLGLPLAVIFLQLPVYMLHQFEEHDRDRFRAFINATIGGGREALTPLAVFVINSAGVWGVDLAALYLAYFVHPALGLIAIDLAVVNGITHIIAALILRRYNPGLWTSLCLLLPVGIWALVTVSAATQADWKMHTLALGTAILVHVLIIAHIKLRLALMEKSASGI